MNSVVQREKNNNEQDQLKYNNNIIILIVCLKMLDRNDIRGIKKTSKVFRPNQEYIIEAEKGKNRKKDLETQ